MQQFWIGFEKRATLLGGLKTLGGRVAPAVSKAYAAAKPIAANAAVKGKAMFNKGKAEVMKTPQRALAGGAALGAGAALGTAAAMGGGSTQAQYPAQAAYY